MFLNYRISLSFVEVIERKLTKFVVYYLLVEMAAEKRNRAKDAVVEEVIQ
jgi:hypothetical protein